MKARGDRKISRYLLGVLAVGLLPAGCGGSAPAPAVPAKAAAAQGPTAAPAPRPPVPSVAPHIPEAGPPLPPLSYDGKGRRDPFAAVIAAVQRNTGLDVSAAKLVGIVEGSGPLALVEAPDGLGYILKPGDVLGNGRVSDVTRGSITFGVAGRGGQRDTTVTLRLVKE